MLKRSQGSPKQYHRLNEETLSSCHPSSRAVRTVNDMGFGVPTLHRAEGDVEGTAGGGYGGSWSTPSHGLCCSPPAVGLPTRVVVLPEATAHPPKPVMRNLDG